MKKFDRNNISNVNTNHSFNPNWAWPLNHPIACRLTCDGFTFWAAVLQSRAVDTSDSGHTQSSHRVFWLSIIYNAPLQTIQWYVKCQFFLHFLYWQIERISFCNNFKSFFFNSDSQFLQAQLFHIEMETDLPTSRVSRNYVGNLLNT